MKLPRKHFVLQRSIQVMKHYNN